MPEWRASKRVSVESYAVRVVCQWPFTCAFVGWRRWQGDALHPSVASAATHAAACGIRRVYFASMHSLYSPAAVCLLGAGSCLGLPSLSYYLFHLQVWARHVTEVT